MLKHLLSLAALTIPVLWLSGGIAHASDADIGGAPVKAIPFDTTYSTVYSTTYVGSPFGYGNPQTIIITPAVPYNAITVTTGTTRLELVNPAPYSTYSGLGTIYFGPNQGILIQPGAIYQAPNHYHHNQGVNCRSQRGASHHHSGQRSSNSC